MNCHVVYKVLFLCFNIFGLSVAQVPIVHLFVQFNAPRQMNNTVFQSIKSKSIIHCAWLCDANSFGPCSRFVWAPDTLTCMLHSKTLYPGTNTVILMSQIEWIIFGRMHTDCTARGYDFESETMTCIRFKTTKQVTWYQAKSLCIQNGGYLISLTSTDKMKFAMNYVYCKKRVWIGLKGHKWVSGDDFDNHTHGFGFQLNNNDKQFSNDTEMNCGMLVPMSTYVFQDNSCSMRTRPKILCEVVIA